MNSTVWYKSKTLWVNLLMLILDVINGTFGAIDIPADVKVYIVMTVNIILRFLTTGPLAANTRK